MPVVLLIIVILALVIIISNISVVQQSRAYVVERLGAFHSVWGVGMHFKVPFIDRVARKVSLKEQVLDYPPQPVITKDNVTMQIDTVVYFQITDPKLYCSGCGPRRAFWPRNTSGPSCCPLSPWKRCSSSTGSTIRQHRARMAGGT